MRLVEPRRPAQPGDRRARAGAGHPGGARHDLRQRVPARPGAVRADRAHRRRGAPSLSPYDLFVFAASALVVGGAARWLFTRTPVGLRMRAAAFAPEVVPAARRQRRPDAHPRLGARRRRSARWPACWSSRPSWACTRTRWTWSSSRRSPRRWSAGWTARPGAVVGGLVVGLFAVLRQRLRRQRPDPARGAGPAAGGAAGPARRAVRRGRGEAGVSATRAARAGVAARRPGRAGRSTGARLHAAAPPRRGRWSSGRCWSAVSYPSSRSATSSSPRVAAYLCATAGLTVLTGLNGQLSLGHGALMATGAYTVALCQTAFADRAIPAAGCCRLSLARGDRQSPSRSARSSSAWPRPGCAAPTWPGSPSPWRWSCRRSRSPSTACSTASRGCRCRCRRRRRRSARTSSLRALAGLDRRRGHPAHLAAAGQPGPQPVRPHAAGRSATTRSRPGSPASTWPAPRCSRSWSAPPAPGSAAACCAVLAADRLARRVLADPVAVPADGRRDRRAGQPGRRGLGAPCCWSRCRT